MYRNLTAAEERIKQLEAVLAELLPHVDVKVLVDSPRYDSPHANDLGQTPLSANLDVVTSPTQISFRESTSPAAEETLPLQADGFDWAEQETLSELSDGMAALAIRPEGTGYLGKALFTPVVVNIDSS